MLKALRILRFLRILRVCKLQKMLGESISLNVDVLSLSMRGLPRVLGVMAMTLHIMACAWHGVGSYDEEGWVREAGLEDSSDARAYVVAMHWSVMTLAGSSTMQL